MRKSYAYTGEKFFKSVQGTRQGPIRPRSCTAALNPPCNPAKNTNFK
jgi:hypothetical protein